MASKYWLKMYHEALHDPKLASLPDNIWRRFWECCLMAGALDEDGFLPPLFEMAYTCRVSEDTIRAELGQMAQRGFVELKLDDDNQERWYVSNFSKRQSPSPAAERMREYRSRKRKENSPQTPLKETDTESDTDTYRTVTRVTNRNDSYGTENNIHTKEYLPPEIQALVTAIAAISKTPYWPKTEEEYSDAAYFLVGKDATPADVARFAEWWALNGFYAGKPALKTILDNWTGFTSGLTAASANGSARPEVIEFAVFDED